MISIQSKILLPRSALWLGCAVLSLAVFVRFKSHLVIIWRGTTRMRKTFKTINQHKKKVNDGGCGVWKNPKSNKFDPHERLLISNSDHLKEKLKRIREAGLNELQICSDFDQTITAFGQQDNPQPSTFGLVRSSDVVSTSFKQVMKGLYDKYHPYEKDNLLSQEERRKYMEEWNQCVQEEYMKEGVTKEMFLMALEQSSLSFRFQFKEFLHSTAKVNLPFYVISGGISPPLITMLNSLTNINGYSNFFLFCNEAHYDEKNVLTRIDMNVNASTKFEKVNAKEFSLGKNTLLFGDYNHDINMKKELNSENVVSILFLRDSLEKDIEHLQTEWDIIVRGDGSFILHRAILSYIGGKEWPEVKISGEAAREFASNPIYDEIKSILQ